MDFPRFLVGFASAVGGLAISIAIAQPSYAQIGLSPMFIEDQAVRGRAQGVLTLSNVSSQPIRARLYSEPFTYDRDGFVSLSEDENDLSPYLQFSPREVSIEPESQQRVRLLGLFPPNLPPGEYRAVVFAEPLNDNSQTGVVSLSARIGATIYMRQGELESDLSGVSVEAAPDEQVLELLVANQGAATARAGVRWQLKRSDTVIAGGTEALQTVIADRDRIFPLALSTTLEPGQYSLVGEFHWMSVDNAVNMQPFELPVLVP